MKNCAKMSKEGALISRSLFDESVRLVGGHLAPKIIIEDIAQQTEGRTMDERHHFFRFAFIS